MVAWQELHIQSNLPLIVLAVSFICIVIIGFLEFKKVSIRMDELSEQIKLLRTIKREPLTNDNNDNNDNGISLNKGFDYINSKNDLLLVSDDNGGNKNTKENKKLINQMNSIQEDRNKDIQNIFNRKPPPVK